MWAASRVWYSILPLMLLFTACAPLQPQEAASLYEVSGVDIVIDDGPLPTRAVTATPTVMPTVTPSPTFTPTVTATPSPAPTVTPTPHPTASPTETSPMLPSERTTRSTSHLAFSEARILPEAQTPPDVSRSVLPSPTPPLAPLVIQSEPGANGHPTLADFWEERAEFVLDIADTGLPMGESATLVMHSGELWSYVHASTASAGVVDRCGNAVPFPGCTVIYRSIDNGRTFFVETPPVCQFECATCPCVSEVDHTEQQQYPRVAYNGTTFFLVYEYLGRTRLRRSTDGLTWSMPERVADTGVWKLWLRTCRKEERIHEHPFVPYEYECLAGGPPGIFVEEGRLYIFVGSGQNPGAMGCYFGSVTTTGDRFTRCQHNPLFVGAGEYGPLDEKGARANPYFDFRTISSAEVQRIGARVYMLYEGVRGPGPGDGGDTQFGLGLARSLTTNVDGPWEKYPGNPILVDQPGNIGLGHADLVVIEGQTFVYTSLNGYTRSRLALVWK